MIRRITIVGVVLAALLFGLQRCRQRTGDRLSVVIEKAPLEVWSVYEGSLESRKLVTISSGLGGGAVTISELVAEGTRVKKGDVLVRLDATQMERELLKLQRDYLLAKADLESLENARLPLELRDIEAKLMEARSQLKDEKKNLDDSRELLSEGLISEQEVLQQEAKTIAAEAQLNNLENQLDLTKKYIHPATLDRARTTAVSAEQELRMATQMVANATILAPADGLVVFRPIPVGGEFRTVRVGDAVYRNQPFLALPDMTAVVVKCSVPESELSTVAVGNKVILSPVAYPDMQLPGTVEQVGAMAQSLMGKPEWQRYFQVTVSLDEVDPRLRPGMTIRARVLSYSASDVALVPREAIIWNDTAPFCDVLRGSQVVRKEIKVGKADEMNFEVLSGLSPGDRVLIP